MEVYIYYFGVLGIDRDEVEDALDASLAEIGGEVSGAGAGENGGNFDLHIPDDVDIQEVRDRVSKALWSLEFSDTTKIVSGADEWLLGGAP
jgi:hypothetical protein